MEWPSRVDGKEQQRVLGVGLDETLDEFAADLIAGLADQGTDRGDHAAAFGAEFFHRLDGGFQDAGQRAFPARMRGTDHARPRIDQQDRAAIGRGGADRKALGAGHDGVGARPRSARPRAGGDNDIGRMGLMHGEKMCRRRRRSARPCGGGFPRHGRDRPWSRCRH